MLKRTILISTLVASMLTVSLNAKGHGDNGQSYNSDRGNYQQDRDRRGHHGNNGERGNHEVSSMDNIPLSNLTDEQKSSLLYMAEEEKLARDTYLYFNDLWGSRIFQNIANSEQKHMDRMKALVDRYELEVPATFNVRGEFQNQELQALYNSLIEKGKSSLIDALEVGVTIEETDIADLEEIIESGDLPEEFKTSYEKLLKGSYNHLKNFNKQLGR